MKKELCVNCLSDKDGVCFDHTEKIEWVTATFTANYKEHTKEEIEREIVYYAKKLSNLKWYQSKRKIIKEIVYWTKRLDKIKHKV